MALSKTEDKPSPASPEPESLAELFHLIRSLVPEGQKLVTASPRVSVAQALHLMRRHSYSQLPVVVGEEVFAVFSYRKRSASSSWAGSTPSRASPCRRTRSPAGRASRLRI